MIVRPYFPTNMHSTLLTTAPGLKPNSPFCSVQYCLLFSGTRSAPWNEPISQLNTQPMISPVNASRLFSRITAHHSGSGWLARPFPVEDFHLLSFASLSWRTPNRAGEKFFYLGEAFTLAGAGGEAPLVFFKSLNQTAYSV